MLFFLFHSLIVADLEEMAIQKLPYKLKFYFRYIDDILLAAPEEYLNVILDVFNSLWTVAIHNWS